MRSFLLFFLLLVGVSWNASAQKGEAYYIELGNQKFSDGKYKEAIDAYSYAIYYNPSNASVFLWRGYSKWYLQDYDGLISDINKAINLGLESKSLGDAYYWKGRSEYYQKSYIEAIKSFNGAMTNGYKNVDAIYLWRGYSYVEAKSYKWAAQDLTKALTYDIDDKAAAYFWVGYSEYQNGNKEVALRAFKKAKENHYAYEDQTNDWIAYLEQNIATGGKLSVDWQMPNAAVVSASSSTYNLKACVKSDQKVTGVKIYINGSEYIPAGQKGFDVVKNEQCTMAFNENIKLKHGKNDVQLVVFAGGKKISSDFRTINYESASIANNTNDTNAEKPKVWAVVVGVASYEAISSLRYSDDDAYQMYAFLKSPEGGALPDEQIRILVDEDASKANIIAELKKKFLQAGSNDLVLMYFSGHGTEGFFVPSDYDGTEKTLLSHKDIQGIFASSKAKNKLCIADACHSGSLSGERSVTTINSYYSALADSKGGMALMMSSKAQETSLEFQGLRQGVFSHYLIRGLKGEADRDRDGIVRVKELFDYVKGRTKQYTAGKQNPLLQGEFDETMPIGAVRTN